MKKYILLLISVWSINILAQEDANNDIKKQLNKVNGIYEVISHSKNGDETDYITKEEPSVSFKNLKDIKLVNSEPYFEFVISISFNDEDAEKFRVLTKENIDKPIAIIVDNKVIIAPIVKSVIPDGNVIISGHKSLQEANEIMNKIKKTSD